MVSKMLNEKELVREQAQYKMVVQDLADRIALEEAAKWSETARFYLVMSCSLLAVATCLWVYWIRYA